MELYDKDFEAWVDAHEGDDPVKLRLRYGTDPVLAEAVSQVALRRKGGAKWDEEGVGRPLRPKWLAGPVAVEQATSAPIARLHASLVAPGSRVLDMTMGSGIDARAIADVNGVTVTAIERDPAIAEIGRLNYASVPTMTVVEGDSVEWLTARPDERYDVIFIDPARRDVNGARVISLADCVPDLEALMPLLLRHAPRVIAKLSPMLDIADTLRRLPAATRAIVVEERGDCRELLIVAEAAKAPEVPVIIEAVNIGHGAFAFTREEEAEAAPTFAMPRVGDVLYEPWAATMKAGPFRTLSARFGVSALHPNTHLYISGCDTIHGAAAERCSGRANRGEDAEPVKQFPGRAYRIVAVLPYASGVMKRFARQWPEASVAVRNFPITAEALRAKLRTRESSTRRVIGVTAADTSPLLLIIDKLPT